MSDVRAARRVSRRWPLISGLVALALVVGAGGLIALRKSPLGVDTEWMNEILENRHPVWVVLSLLMDFLGGGWFGVFVVPLATVGLLCLFRRFFSALFYAIAAAASAGLLQLLKNLFGRARPDDILVTADFGSFPSGHVANAATVAVALGLILRYGWVWAAGAAYTVLMLLSRTYLGAHWLSDTLGGLLLGTAVAVIVWAPLAGRVHRERRREVPIDTRSPRILPP